MTDKPENIFKQAAQGDQSAWRKIFEIFSGPVYQFFLKNTSSVEVANDKVQEVFIKIYRNKEKFTYGSLKAWIFKICRNTLIDTYRRRNPQEVLSDIIPETAPEEQNLEEEVISNIEHRQMVGFIDSCLDQMPHDDRMVISLVYLAGLSVPEMAEVMEIPLGTAKTRVRKSRLLLNKMLNEKMQIRKFEQAQ